LPAVQKLQLRDGKVVAHAENRDPTKSAGRGSADSKAQLKTRTNQFVKV